jgi:hypothetical protein
MPAKDKQQQNDEQLKKNNSTKNRTVHTSTDTDQDTSSPTPGSMSEGNQSNNPYGRERRRVPHSKMNITGSDDDGQAV